MAVETRSRPEAESGAAAARVREEAYVRYTLEFFRRWIRYYDAFATSIFWAYDSLVRRVAPRPGTSLLDICTGTGQVLLRCAQLGARVTGIDLSPDMLRRARRKAARKGIAVDLHLGDARSLPFADDAFDAVTISFALHDMPRQVRFQVLSEAVRVSTGRIIILDYDLPKSRLVRRPTLAAIGRFESPFFRRFAEEGLEAMLRDADLPRPTVHRDWSGLFSVFELDFGSSSEVAASADLSTG